MSLKYDEYDIVEIEGDIITHSTIDEDAVKERKTINQQDHAKVMGSSERTGHTRDKTNELSHHSQITMSDDRCNPLYDLTAHIDMKNHGNAIVDNVSENMDDDSDSAATVNLDALQSEDSNTCISEGETCVASLPSSPKIREVSIPLLPHVDCPEKIVLCLDISSEMNKATFKAKAGQLYSALNMMKKSVAMFVKTKAILDKRNQFALVTLTDSAEWLCDFTDNIKEVLYILDSLLCPVSSDSLPANLCVQSLYDTIYQNTELPTVEGDSTVLPPPFILRVVLVYGQSHGLPDLSHTPSLESRKMLDASPYFYFDCIYLHEPITQFDKCEEIYDNLTKIADKKGLSYIFEVSRNPTKVYDNMAKLLAHPLQRVLQTEAHYKIKCAWAED